MRRSLVVTLAAALLLAGCGIPDNTPVLPIGPGPSTGTSSGDEVAPALPRREDTDKPSQLVLNYLKATAGDPDDALVRVKGFLSPAAAAMFKPQQPEVQVIHLVEQPLNNPGSGEVSFKAREVGTLGNNGILDPSTDPTPTEYKFLIAAVAGQAGLFVAKAPPILLLSDDALGSYYDLRTIYFWNTERTALVPDVRYMPRSVPPEQQPTEVLNWLIAYCCDDSAIAQTTCSLNRLITRSAPSTVLSRFSACLIASNSTVVSCLRMLDRTAFRDSSPLPARSSCH